MDGKRNKNGVLYVTRLGANGNVLKSERRRFVCFHASSNSVAYYADSEMLSFLGAIDLRYATVEQGNQIGKDAFILKDNSGDKVFRFCDKKDPANSSVWYALIGSAIKEIRRPSEYGIQQNQIKGGYMFTMQVRSSRNDEVIQIPEYEIFCRVLFLSKVTNAKTQTCWSTWRSFEEFKSFDSQMRKTFGWQMNDIEFPRERKRDSFSSSKSIQANRKETLDAYLQQVGLIPLVTDFHKHHGSGDLKNFVNFDIGFGEDAKISNNEKESYEVDDQIVSAPKTDANPKESEISSTSSNSSDDISSCEEDGENNLTDSYKYELVTGEEAATLNSAILQAVSDNSNGNSKIVRKFRSETRYFGKGNRTIDEYCMYLETSFGAKFTSWLLKDIAHLVPSFEQRKALVAYSESIENGTHTVINTNPIEAEKVEEEKVKEEIVVKDNVLPSSFVPEIVDFESNPSKAKEIHQSILDRIYVCFHKDMERVDDFQDQTRSFGKNEISSAEYVAYFIGAVGPDDAQLLIPEMARILPNEDKRLKLLACTEKSLHRLYRRRKQRSKQLSGDEGNNHSIIKDEQQLNTVLYNEQKLLRPNEFPSGVSWDNSNTESDNKPNRYRNRAKQMSASSAVAQKNISSIRPRSHQHISHVIEENKTLSYEDGIVPGANHVNSNWNRNKNRSKDISSEIIGSSDIDAQADHDYSNGTKDRRKSRSKESSSEVLYTDYGMDDKVDHDYLNRNKNTTKSRSKKLSSSLIDREAIDDMVEVDSHKKRPKSRSKVKSFGSIKHTSGNEAINDDHGWSSKRNSSNNIEYIEKEKPVGVDSESHENPVLARLRKQGAVNFLGGMPVA